LYTKLFYFLSQTSNTAQQILKQSMLKQEYTTHKYIYIYIYMIVEVHSLNY
jgi:hypothetical protein